MEIIKKYWWAFALVIALVVAWYVWFRKPKTDKTVPAGDPSCTTPIATWNAAVAGYEDAIEADQTWRQGVIDRAQQYGVSYDERKRLEAEQMAKSPDHGKLCKPAGA